ncbi:MAG: hypothetical protein HC828_05965 [Blastochloris sp.]|nr:hypothetical protein [Blastochloris sp.]
MTRPEVRPVTAQGLSQKLSHLGFQHATKAKFVGFIVGCVQGNTTPTVCIVGLPGYGLDDMAEQLQTHGYHVHIDEAGEVLHVVSRSLMSKE